MPAMSVPVDLTSSDPVSARIEQYYRDLNNLDEEVRQKREALSEQFQKDMAKLLPTATVFTGVSTPIPLEPLHIRGEWLLEGDAGRFLPPRNRQQHFRLEELNGDE